MFKHILVPTDGSPLSEEAMRAAVAFARDAKAKVTGFHVVTVEPHQSPYRLGYAFAAESELAREMERRTREAAEQCLQVIKDTCAKAGVACETRMEMTSDAVYRAIIRAAEEVGCDLIFMASHGRGGIEAVVMGSETNKVLTHCRIPVLVYR